ncbi:MAG TPA: addiction module protein [Planctomycetota bacterium]|nr:addiction module protein [Planctomycetota bacterium]
MLKLDGSRKLGGAPVSERGARLLDEALALPPEERAELAERLWSSLDAASQRRIDELWAEEVEARLDAYDRGEIEAIPAEKAIAEALLKARR